MHCCRSYGRSKEHASRWSRSRKLLRLIVTTVAVDALLPTCGRCLLGRVFPPTCTHTHTSLSACSHVKSPTNKTNTKACAYFSARCAYMHTAFELAFARPEQRSVNAFSLVDMSSCGRWNSSMPTIMPPYLARIHVSSPQTLFWTLALSNRVENVVCIFRIISPKQLAY